MLWLWQNSTWASPHAGVRVVNLRTNTVRHRAPLAHLAGYSDYTLLLRQAGSGSTPPSNSLLTRDDIDRHTSQKATISSNFTDRLALMLVVFSRARLSIADAGYIPVHKYLLCLL